MVLTFAILDKSARAALYALYRIYFHAKILRLFRIPYVVFSKCFTCGARFKYFWKTQHMLESVAGAE